MDLEPISNISANETFDPDENYHSRGQNQMAIIIVLITSAGILADFLITYVILRNESLRTRTNIYLANFCICNIFYFLFTPIILNLFSAAESIHASFICFADEFFFLFMLGDYIFICILLLDWYVVTYKSLNASARCRASYKLVIASVWTVLFVLLVTVTLQCTAGISLFPFIAAIAIIIYFGSFILAAYICVMKIINEKTTSTVEVKVHLELHYVTSYFLCWFPNWVYISLFIFVPAVSRMLNNSINLGLSTFIIGYMHAFILLIIMYKKDIKFRSALRKFLCDSETEDIVVSIHKSDEHFTSLI